MPEVLIHYRLHPDQATFLARWPSHDDAASLIRLEAQHGQTATVLLTEPREPVTPPDVEALSDAIRASYVAAFTSSRPRLALRAANLAVRLGAWSSFTEDDLRGIEAAICEARDDREAGESAARWIIGAEALMQDGRAVL